jgi:hypothetical protein
VQVLIDLHAPDLQTSAWNCEGRPTHFGATTVVVTHSIPKECAGRSNRTRGNVAVRHFAASESLYKVSYRQSKSSVIPVVPGC